MHPGRKIKGISRMKHDPCNNYPFSKTDILEMIFSRKY